jgi:hypothetical protein
MSDVSLELQGAITQALKGNAALTALIAGRVYDRVPRNSTGQVTAVFPYVSYGPEQDIPEQADCMDASDIFLQIDIWSRGVGRPEAKQIARAVKDVLHDADLSLTDNALVSLSYEGRRVLVDSDGLTTQIAMTFQAVVEEH